jgi:hypothetical protein
VSIPPEGLLWISAILPIDRSGVLPSTFALGWKRPIARTERAKGAKFEGNSQVVIVAVY